MSKITLVTGGARSGKSSFAQSILQDKEVLYIATSIPFDDEMNDRIRKHREDRPHNWDTIECYKDIYIHLKDRKEKYMLLDCLTIMVTNLMFYYEKDWDNIDMDGINKIEALIADEIKKLIECVRSLDINLVIVTNELGMGIVPASLLSRAFRDIAGRMNQIMAKLSDEVYFVVSGIPMKIK
jgi:adenosylcobinamide kinase / adenosylcobinamide-phosphate guanylyltransferase